MRVDEWTHVVHGEAARTVDLDDAEARVWTWAREFGCGFGVVGTEDLVGGEVSFAFGVVGGDDPAYWSVHAGERAS